jgi:NAD(P)-dependent dehydrogenase (short-subunit alcohol dehydrogenase family)
VSSHKKNILITGVGKGLGEEFLKYFTSRGFFVFGITRSKSDLVKLKSLKNCKIYIGDVCNEKTIKKILQDSIKEKKIIYGIINNAGIRHRQEFKKIKLKELERTFQVNYFSIFKIMQIFLKYSLKLKIKSSIVNIGSIVGGKQGFSNLTAYASSKGALKSLTQSFAIEVAKYGVRANTINPGFIKTSYYNSFKKKKKLYNWTISRIPMKHWGEPKHISGLAEYLLSEKSEYLTGETINIDGGWTNA